MNGRLYDAKLHRFLQPDNYVQDPYNTQNYNRYGYVLGNPLVYIDPSGEFLTWSFSGSGFSIGINLTPIGIPLGGGINVGWGNGFSMGAYYEVGYRVGGTGFGTGAVVSNSFDFNFVNQSWTTTISVSAYASFGPFNAGVNLSGTYDFNTKQWQAGWGVSVGVGTGYDNGKGGLGFNVGYGSGGFTYGVGGFNKIKGIEPLKPAENKPNVKNPFEQGQVGLALNGIKQNNEHIVSPSNTAKYRVPDEMIKFKTEIIQIGEVKNYRIGRTVSYTNQIKDFITYSVENKIKFVLYVPKGVNLSKPLDNAIKNNSKYVSVKDF